ncbi:hypothetical protein SAMN04488056_110117 [Cohaesibacter marisflavi]|uniref:Uncharacterized protein n=1 Tax=Cohaesibacter marisflavi TaxID=655353 RepID=A0A1I5J0B0_9HYPH|nr:hypothetical protein SAMN04488056_110117 [Cohaesibacter marisflavi]
MFFAPFHPVFPLGYHAQGRVNPLISTPLFFQRLPADYNF